MFGIMPRMWKLELFFLQICAAFFKAGIEKNFFERIDLLISSSDCQTMRPAPIVKWPTSEPPIVFFGRPTAPESALSFVVGQFFLSEFMKGVFARVTALY